MIGFQNQVPPKSLTAKSSLTMLLRTLYRMGLDYCVLPPAEDRTDVIIFTKDQIISLIERSSSEMSIAEIPACVAQGLFKPVAILKSGSLPGDFLSDGGFAEPEKLQVFVIDEDGARELSLKEAISPRIPDFPEWWEAPVPFAMCGYGKVHVNRTALLMFGPGLKNMSINDVPDKNEFMVTLEGEESRCSVSFYRLEGDIFVLEDSTADIEAAEEVSWWAAVGKAWAATLDLEKRSYRRCGAEEAESISSENSTVLPCEWEGELLGYFCVENKKDIKAGGSGKTRQTQTAVPKQTGKAPAAKRVSSAAAKKDPKKTASQKPTPENDALNALGPQTLGLLAPGMTLPDAGASEEAEQGGQRNKQENMPVKKKPVKREKA